MLSKMEGLFHFHINSFSSTFKTFLIQSGIFFYILIYQEYYALPRHDFKANIQEGKKIFKIAKSITRRNIFTGK